MLFIFTILGAYTTYSFWGNHIWLGIITLIITLYQASSLREMARSSDNWQTNINMLCSLLIIGLFIYSFFI